MIKELVKKNRSYRRFYQEKKLTRQQLMELVETARLTPSAANRQPFKYRIVCDEEENEKVFRLLGFAGYLKDWDGPSEGEKPTGYIVITCPANVNDEVDAGIVGQTLPTYKVQKIWSANTICTIQIPNLITSANKTIII